MCIFNAEKYNWKHYCLNRSIFWNNDQMWMNNLELQVKEPRESTTHQFIIEFKIESCQFLKLATTFIT